MHCDSCKRLIESELRDKVKKISVNLETNKAQIEFDENKIMEDEIIAIISSLGYDVKN